MIYSQWHMEWRIKDIEHFILENIAQNTLDFTDAKQCYCKALLFMHFNEPMIFFYFVHEEKNC